jgi:1,4-alpha-glucan branching enzyme
MPTSSTDSHSSKKRLAVQLRAQLPYSREQDWLFPVLTESYLPLLKMLGRLADEEVDYRITLAFPATLRAMLEDSAVQRRYVRWLEDEIATAESEIVRQKNIPPLLVLALDERDRLVDALKTFTHDWRCDVPQQWGKLVASGHVELAATAATGAALPDLEPQPEFLRAQIQLGRESAPSARGFLPPEGALSPEVARQISAAGLQWAMTECTDSSPFVTDDGLVVFPSDPEMRWLIEDAHRGYPAAPVYRTFHTRQALKYYAGGVDREKPTVIYEFRRAEPMLHQHVASFLANVREFSLVCLERETLGHWWVEGVLFLEMILRSGDEISLITPSDFLKGQPVLPVRALAQGDASHADTGTAKATSSLLDSVAGLAEEGVVDGSLSARALQQAMRECLISQCSDWQLMRAADPDGLGRTAQSELNVRLERARNLVESVRSASPSELFVSECESASPVFPNLDWRGMLPRK